MPDTTPSRTLAHFALIIVLTIVSFAAVIVGFSLVAIGASDGSAIKAAIGALLVFGVLGEFDFLMVRSYRAKKKPDGTAAGTPVAGIAILNLMVVAAVVGIIWQAWKHS